MNEFSIKVKIYSFEVVEPGVSPLPSRMLDSKGVESGFTFLWSQIETTGPTLIANPLFKYCENVWESQYLEIISCQKQKQKKWMRKQQKHFYFSAYNN